MATQVKSKDFKEWLENFTSYVEGLQDGIDEEKLNVFLDSFPVPGDDENTSGADRVMEFYDRIQNDKEFRTMVFDKKNEAKFGKAMELAANVITTGMEIGDAKEQIRQADAEARKLQKPTTPSLLEKNPKLKAALRRAELDLAGEGDKAFLSPYEQAIQDQYTKDIGVAKTASAGQAGAYGAMAQQASTNRLGAARQMVPMLHQKRLQDAQNYQNLLGMDIDENQFRKRQAMSQYAQNLGQYNIDRDLISKTGSLGRQNLALSRRSMAGNLVNTAKPMYDYLPMKFKTYLSGPMNKFQQDLSS